MPKVRVNDIMMNYEQQGTGEPLILIPYLAADNACYAFQLGEYSKHFTCISIDPRGAGETDKPEGGYSTESFADDVAGFMQAVGVERAHVSGLSLGAAIGMWLAGKYPQEVKSLSLHSAWPKTDPFLKTVAQSWQAMAKGLGSVTEMVIGGIFPLVLHAGAVRGQAGVYRFACGVRPQPSGAAARCVRPSVKCRDRPRCSGDSQEHRSPDANHQRSLRHGNLNSIL
jgi:pimeloyl-ACP methyl ester carboxylesterase